ncbi:hypothetical protein BGZ65_012756, partial [Modicella reniformis]
QQPALFETPRSPASRSGLGIQVEESFTGPDATHPLESSSAILAATNTQTEAETQARPITFHEEDSAMSIGDIIVAEQASSQQHQEMLSAHSSEASDVDQTRPNSMPTPPPTSRVQFQRVMETTTSQRPESPNAALSANDNLTSLPTPFTPGFGFATSQEAASTSEQTIHVSNASVSTHPVRGTSPQAIQSNPHEQNQTLDRSTRAGSTLSSASSVSGVSSIKDGDRDHEEQDEDPSMLPLWVQRQRHIRRQSLIPRPDLVKGNSITLGLQFV